MLRSQLVEFAVYRPNDVRVRIGEISMKSTGMKMRSITGTKWIRGTVAVLLIFLMTVMSLGVTATESFAADEGKYSRASVYLNDIERYVFNEALRQIKLIAEGKRGDSRIEIDLTSKLSGKSYTAQELGLSTVFAGGGKYSNDAKTKVRAKELGNLNLQKVIEALLADAPYELYWYDKTATTIQGISASHQGSPSVNAISVHSARISMDLPVAAYYSKRGVRDTTDLDTSKTSASAKIVESAKSIVKKVENKSDIEKLTYYKDEICRLATYNHAVASDPRRSEKYGDPYQMIYVFDGNQNTAVTCEGYSKAFKFLCDLTTFKDSTIHCYMVSGHMSGGTGAGPHTWNLVHIGGQNYLVDVTNCDSGTIGSNDGRFDGLFMKGDSKGNSSRYSKQFGRTSIDFQYDAETIRLYSASERTISKSDYNTGSSSGTSKSVWHRLYGNGRYDTMQAIVEEGFTKAGGTLVIATGENFKDALAASGLAGLYDAPIILTNGKNLSSQASALIRSLKPTRVFIAGGTFAISDNVFNQIKQVSGVTPKRIFGNTSADTSAKLALEGKGRWSSEGIAIIATNKSFKDALSVSPISYAMGYPIFLAADGKTLTNDEISALKELDIKKAIIVGGTGAVTPDVERVLNANNISVLTRLGGRNGVETSAIIARYGLGLKLSANKMGVATSQNYPDALAGAALCGHNRSILVLADDKAMGNASFPSAYRDVIETGYVFGGKFAVGDKTMDALNRSTSK